MNLSNIAIIGLLLVSMFCTVQIIKIQAKARIAQYLIAEAWQQSLNNQQLKKPWSWADTWPVLRLEFASGKKQFVLHGMHGQSLAFGPAHMNASAMPGEGKEIVIAAHRDTHFSELKNLVLGEEIKVQDTHRHEYTYRVTTARIVDSNKQSLELDSTQEVLRLITCYPFDAVNPNGPLRYEIIAIPTHSELEQANADFKHPDWQSRL
ncbi:MAG: class GN sortase [Gammaproteobacteria bacterium]|nr:class GN sortase [Gammaproteobacteria bacterium]NNC97925.1 class GN sortase [Gammaproteobacteria bacterium]NNM14277.1 class GN sortase [Gammaproteobacteria bacterium]